jgi:hypothetical protein
MTPAAIVERVFELANNAYSLYVSHGPAEKAKLLNHLFSSCVVDAARVAPTYKKPFDMIFRRAEPKEWLEYLWQSPPPSV